jgi:hypothetical protein
LAGGLRQSQGTIQVFTAVRKQKRQIVENHQIVGLLLQSGLIEDASLGPVSGAIKRHRKRREHGDIRGQ